MGSSSLSISLLFFYKKIENALFLSENTIKMHTSSLYRVLGVNNRDELRSLFKK